MIGLRGIVATALMTVAGACTGNFEEYHHNPNETTDSELERDNYNVGAKLLQLQNEVIPSEEHLYQFTEILTGMAYGGYSEAIPTWTGKFSTFNPTADWLKAPFVTLMTDPYAPYRGILAVTDGEMPLALASLLRVAIMHRLTDQYGPIPYSKVIENRQNSLAVAGGVIESNSDHAQFKPAVNRTVICFGEWKQHPISADLDSYMNGYADPRRAGMDGLVLRFSGSVTAAAAALTTGCKSDDYDDGTSPVTNTAYIVEAATTPDAPVTFKRTVETLDREFVVRLVAPVDTPTRVELIVDAEAAAEYNRRHGTSYPVLDAAHYDFTQRSVSIDTGKIESEAVMIHFKGLDQLDMNQTLLLPVSIASTSNGLGLLRG